MHVMRVYESEIYTTVRPIYGIILLLELNPE